MVVIDSDIIIEFLRDNKQIVEKIKYFNKENIEIYSTTINTFELFRGFINYKKDSLEAFNDFLNNLVILDFDVNASKKAAEIFEYLKAKGEVLDIADIMIASIVLVNNETLLTNNKKHFSRISELRLESL